MRQHRTHSDRQDINQQVINLTDLPWLFYPIKAR
jgi:hypothetical protein